jgi:hypothetical protein
MKKILALFLFGFLSTQLIAQDTTITSRKIVDISNRSNDHLLLQLGYTNWANKPDTLHTTGFSKSLNIYLMFDFPFKTNPKLSMAVGLGVGSDHIIFTGTNIGIKEIAPEIRFTNVSDTNHFKKSKLATCYLEAPVELRFSSRPSDGKGFKFALGAKVGTMLNAHTRNTKLQSQDNTLINEYVMKESSKRFFNRNRLVGTARIGYSNFTVYGSYQITSLFKDGAGPDVRPYSIGLTLSGL